jgi:5'-nucleotidase
VNIPANAKPDTEIVITNLAHKMYHTRVHHRHDPRGRSYYWIDGTVVENAEKGTDLHTILKTGKVSVTPLTADMTAHTDDKALKKMIERAFKKQIEPSNNR